MPILLGAPTSNVPIFVLLLILGHAITAFVVIWGALSMRRLQNYPLAVIGAVTAMLPLHPFTWLIGLPMGIWALAVLSRPEVRLAFGRPAVGPRLAPLLVLIGALALVPLGFIAALSFSYLSVRRTVVATPATVGKSIEFKTIGETKMDYVSGRELEWKDGVPQLRQLPFELDETQKTGINRALANIHASYREVEEKHIERKTNELGHQVVRIQPFQKDLNRLENQFWTEVDAAVTDNNQRGRLREHIQLQEKVLPFGSYPVAIEMWKVGEWFNWRWNESSPPSRGPSLPEHMQHLWKEEPKEEVITEAIKGE